MHTETPTYYAHVDTPIGAFLLAGDERRIRVASFATGHQQRRPEPDWIADRGPLTAAIEQIEAYFAGDLRTFELDLDPVGTPFQRDVWRVLRSIPFGETRSYAEVADAVGRPTAFRAVGAANGANRIPLIIPCHRVVGSDGSLTGFGGGIDTKRWLLAFEGQQSLF